MREACLPRQAGSLSSARMTAPRKKLRHRLTFEGHITWLIVGAVAPSAVVALALLWFGDYTPKVQWTLTLLIGGCALGFLMTARDQVVRPLQTMSNLLAA